jgi:hypothetical protein
MCTGAQAVELLCSQSALKVYYSLVLVSKPGHMHHVQEQYHQSI